MDEQRASAELIGIDRGAAPAWITELDAYHEEIRPRLYARDEAIRALRLTFHPPVPDRNRALTEAQPMTSVHKTRSGR